MRAVRSDLRCGASAVVVFFAAAAVVVRPGATSAEDDARCHGIDQHQVLIRFGDSGFSSAFREQLLAELDAALAPRGLRACRTATHPLAVIVLETQDLPRVAVAIDVEDAVTRKTVRRSVDLAPFPEDSRALALAMASDELLRASWMELALADAPEPARPPPAAVRRTVEEEVNRSAPSRTMLGIRGAAGYFTADQTELGGDLILMHWISSAVALSISVGMRRSLAVQTPQASIAATATGGSLRARFRMFGSLSSEAALDLFVGSRIANVLFEGEANGDTASASGSGVAVLGEGGLSLALHVGPELVLALELGAGGAFRGVVARVDGNPALGADGLELFSAVVIGWML